MSANIKPYYHFNCREISRDIGSHFKWLVSKRLSHDDVIKWKHFPRYWPFVKGIPPVTSGFPSQRPVTGSFGVFFLPLNKRLSKHSKRRWFELPSCLLWRHCNAKSLIAGEKLKIKFLIFLFNTMMIGTLMISHGSCLCTSRVNFISHSIKLISS